MDNPFSLIAIMWKAKRPSLTKDMKAVRNSFWIRGNYAALTFFGTIVTATEADAQEANGQYSQLKHHETIHLRQAQSCHDSWLRFYLLYLWFCLRALPQCRHMRKAHYWLNPFEIEAYLHDREPDYLERNGNLATEWRQWAKMKPTERLRRLIKQSAAYMHRSGN